MYPTLPCHIIEWAKEHQKRQDEVGCHLPLYDPAPQPEEPEQKESPDRGTCRGEAIGGGKVTPIGKRLGRHSVPLSP